MDDEVSPMERFMEQEMEAGHRLQVFRKHPRTGKLEYVETCNAEGFDLETCRSRFGGGTFHFKLIDGKGRYLKGTTQEIAGPHKDLTGPEDDEEEELRRLQRRKLSDLDGLGTVELLLEMRRDVRDAIRELRNPHPQAHQQNPMELTASVLGAFQQMLQPYQEAILNKREEGVGVEQLMEVYMRGVETAREIGAAGDGYASVVRELGQPLVKILEKHATAQSAERSIPAMTGATANPPAGGGQGTVGPQWLETMRPWIPMLVQWAERGKHPGLAAEWVVDELPPEHLAPVEEQVERGQQFESEFFAAVPRAAQDPEWYRRFFAGVRELLDDPAPTDVSSDGEVAGPPPPSIDTGGDDGS